MKEFAAALAVLVMSVVSAGAGAATQYRAIDLGDLAGGLDYSRVFDLNDLGEVVGESAMGWAPDAATAAAIGAPLADLAAWEGGRGFVASAASPMLEVGPVTVYRGGVHDAGEPSVQPWIVESRIAGSARAIDEAGTIYVEAKARGIQLFSFTPDYPSVDSVTPALAGSLELSARTRVVDFQVNAASGGAAVGGAGNEFESQAISWAAASGVVPFVPLSESNSQEGVRHVRDGVLPDYASDINRSGVVVGVSAAAATLWATDGSSIEVPVLPDDSPASPLGNSTGCPSSPGTIYGCWTSVTPPDNRASAATAINDAGAVVGTSTLGGFLWDGQEVTFLAAGETAFSPADLDNAGNIVGVLDGIGAAIRIMDGSFVELTAVSEGLDGWVLTEAVAMNAHGQIAANGMRNGVMHAFLLSPVPEPAAALMLLAGLPMVFLRGRRGAGVSRIQV
ncbi:MAG: hypothetical protein FHP92_02265 [Denitromonas halophila]|nr:MAG: hypothetical protein FHP92_02265 [Denitromonas halophila]